MKLLETLKTRWVVWVWIHTPNCAEMTRLTSLAFERPPSLRLRFRMWLHQLICVWCLRYQRQLRFLHHAGPRLREDLDQASSQNLSQESKRRMVERLREERRH